MKPETVKKLWIGLAILAILSPIGLVPDWLGLGEKGAWGEWGPDELEGYDGPPPSGMERLANIWNAMMPDYSIPGWDTPLGQTIAYIISAILGIAIMTAIIYGLGRVTVKRRA